MIQYALNEGIIDQTLLTGKMSRSTCNIVSHAKLKHRTCKLKLNSPLMLCFSFTFNQFTRISYFMLCFLIALKIGDWSRDQYFHRQTQVLDLILAEAIKMRKVGKRVDMPELDFKDTIERV
jgi:hypothetical protein